MAGVAGTTAEDAAGSGGSAPTQGGSGAGSTQGGTTSSSGGATGGSAGTASSGGPTLKSLTPDELDALCMDVKAIFDETDVEDKALELTCRYAGLLVAAASSQTGAELQRDCQRGYERCIATQPQTVAECTKNADCTATVADFKACAEEYATYLDRFLEGLPTCGQVTTNELDRELEFEPEPTPKCAVVWEKCNATF